MKKRLSLIFVPLLLLVGCDSGPKETYPEKMMRKYMSRVVMEKNWQYIKSPTGKCYEISIVAPSSRSSTTFGGPINCDEIPAGRRLHEMDVVQ